jgi:hypothetical protein
MMLALFRLYPLSAEGTAAGDAIGRIRIDGVDIEVRLV